MDRQTDNHFQSLLGNGVWIRSKDILEILLVLTANLSDYIVGDAILIPDKVLF